MGPQELLRIAAHADGRLQPAIGKRLVSWARRWAVSCRSDRKGRQPPKAINALAGSQQVEFHNRTRVRGADELIDLSTKRPRVSGSGRWKQLDPRQVLRTTFASPASTLKSLAHEVDSSSRYVTDLLFMCAQMLKDRARLAVDSTLTSVGVNQWVVLQVMWDETQFRLLPSGERGAPEGVSVLAAHGHLMWSSESGREPPQEDELVIRPCAMANPAVACMWSALLQILPSSVWGLLSSSAHLARPWVASLNLGADHAKANLRLIAEIQNRAPPNVITPHGLCKQHASGLCIGVVVKHLNIICPAFCVAKLFRRGNFSRRFQVGLRAAVAADLQWIRASENSRRPLRAPTHMRDARPPATHQPTVPTSHPAT